MGSNPKPHLLAVPFSVQGHAKHLLNICYRIASQGIRVTFVTTESLHSSIVSSAAAAAAAGEEDLVGKYLKFESVPDGLENASDRRDVAKFRESIKRVLPGHLLEFAGRMKNSDEPITAVITDAAIGWVLDVGEEIGAQLFAFWVTVPGSLAFLSSTPDLNVFAVRYGNGDPNAEKMMVEMAQDTLKTLERVKYILCNSFHDLDPLSSKLQPKILHVGPLTTLSNSPSIFAAREETDCLKWLDTKHPNSVIYVAFGGTGVLSQHQFHELALGLELSGRPFIWVIPSKNQFDESTYPDGFLERISNFGKIVKWAPQEKILAHPATASFLTHCGWSSFMEGLNCGVPFLCWAFTGEQFFNQYYISDVFKVALKMDSDENGIKTKEEISTKINMLMSNDEIKAKVLKLKDLGEKSMSKEGSSYQNLQSFINQLKE